MFQKKVALPPTTGGTKRSQLDKPTTVHVALRSCNREETTLPYCSKLLKRITIGVQKLVKLRENGGTKPRGALSPKLPFDALCASIGAAGGPTRS